MSETQRPEIGREIATTADGIDITRGYFGPLLQPYDRVLQNRGGGDLEIYEQVYSDPEVRSALNQRHLAVVSCETQVDPGGDSPLDIAAADHLREQLNALKWDKITEKMLMGEHYGYSVAEMIYKPDGNYITIGAIKVRNRRRFRFGKLGDLRLLTMTQMYEGIPAEEPYFWSFNCGSDNDDEPYGLGLAHWLYWPVLFKRAGIKFWLIFLEKFGMPTAVGKYDPDATDAEKGKLLQATRAVQTDAGVIMPKEMELALLEAGRSGTADYQALVNAMDAMIQKVVLGQTASTQGTPGKLGNDDLGADVRADIVKASADLICESFTAGPATWLTQWNFPGAAIPRVSRVTEEPEDLDASAERDTKISGMGFKPTLKHVHDKYGGEWVEKAQTPPPPIPGVDPANPTPAQFAEGDTTRDPSAPMARQLDRQLATAGGKWIEQIRALVDQTLERGGTLEDVRDGIVVLAPDMSLEDYAAAMADALTAATLAGRADVLSETGEP